MTKENVTFEFRPFEPAEVWDEINCLDITKKTSGGVIIIIIIIICLFTVG